MARIRHGRRYLTASYVSLSSISSSLEGTFLEMTFCNTENTAARKVQVRFVPSGSSAGDQHLVIDMSDENALRPGETRVYSFEPFLQAGDYVQWKADTTNKVTADLAVNEE